MNEIRKHVHVRGCTNAHEAAPPETGLPLPPGCEHCTPDVRLTEIDGEYYYAEGEGPPMNVDHAAYQKVAGNSWLYYFSTALRLKYQYRRFLRVYYKRADEAAPSPSFVSKYFIRVDQVTPKT
jgi:hypothetical protein